MAWRASERLVQLSGAQQQDDDTDKGDHIAAKSIVLPEDETSTAVRSREVFYDLATTQFRGRNDEPKMDVSHMKEAMEMCGLDSDKCGRMYGVSKWAKTDANDSALDLAEFQLVIERFSSPARLQKQLRQKVDEYMTRHNLEFVYTVDNILQTDSLQECKLLPRVNRMTLRSMQQAEIKNWDEVLDGLTDI